MADRDELSAVKIADAEHVVRVRGLDWAIVIGKNVNGYHRATYGKEPEDKDEAVACADYCLRELGGFDPTTITDKRAENGFDLGWNEAMSAVLRASDLLGLDAEKLMDVVEYETQASERRPKVTTTTDASELADQVHRYYDAGAERDAMGVTRLLRAALAAARADDEMEDRS